MHADDEPADFTRLDDPAFLAERARLRDRLEHVPDNAAGRAGLERLYEAMNREFDRRASAAWTMASEGLAARARLLAVEVLLAEPELLGNDALEGDLYILRDKLKAGVLPPGL